MESLPTVALFIDGLAIPPKQGIAAHTYQLARSLATSGVAVTVVLADRAWATPAQLADEPFSTLLIPADAYYNRTYIVDLLQTHRFDIVQNYNCYYIASILGPAAQKTSIPLVAEQHDVEADLAFLHSDPQEVLFQQRMQQASIAFAARARVMSSHDHTVLRDELPAHLAERLWYLPVGIACPPPIKRPPIPSRKAVFIGNCAYAPNREAAISIIGSIAPLLPDITFLIAGPETETLDKYVLSANVTLLGPVDELDSLLAEASLGLAPIRQGSGMKIKLITYLAAGLPVVATDIACYGYPDSGALIKAETDAAAADAILSLLDTRAAWHLAHKAALATYADYFDIGRTIHDVIAVYQDILASEQPSPLKDESIEIVDMRHFPWHKELQQTARPTVKTALFIPGKRI